MKKTFTLLCMVWSLCFFSRAQEGQLIDRIVVSDQGPRTYKLYVPAAFDGSEEWPLVIMLHGIEMPIEALMVLSQMNAIADTAQFLVAYPQSLRVPNFGLPLVGNPDTISIWNDGVLPDLGIDDVGFLDKMIDDIALGFSINTARVYAAGTGNGAGIAGRLACERPNRIAAIGDVEGFIGCLPSSPIPTLITFSTADPFVPFEGGGGLGLPAVMDFVNGWAAANGCSGEFTEEALPDIVPEDSSTVARLTYNGCDSRGETVFYRIDSGGRIWPGAPAEAYPPPILEVIGNLNQDIHASVEIWNFFNRHTHPDPAPVPRLLDLTLQHQDSTRKYLLYVPSGYDGNEEWPLVINMHGLGSNRFGQMGLSQMNAVADTGNFLVVYPEATLVSHPLLGVVPSWNPEQIPERADDVDFIDQLIQTLGQNWKIDIARVYTTGMSQGGVMSYLLACNIPDRIASMASVSGVSTLNLDWTCTANRSMPILHIHGSADLIAPIGGGVGVLGPALVFPPIRSQLEAWINANNCALDSTVTTLPDLNTMDSSTVTLTQFQNCDTYIGIDSVERMAEVWFYQIESGGHTWPGGPPTSNEEVFGNVNRDMHASVEIWNFFNRHMHPDPAPVPQLLKKTIMVDTLERSYLIYVPAAYDGSEEWPLVFNLHGATSSAREQMLISGMNAVADTGRFLLVYPEGISNLAGNTGWNEPQSPAIQDDVLFISTLIDSIGGEYAVNQNSVYSCGMSNGGGMSYTLASALSDRLAAIASVAAPGTSEPNPDRPIPILYMHGTADRIVPFNGGLSEFVPVEFPAAWDRVQFWTNNNGCMDSTLIMIPDINTADSSIVELIKYQQCTPYTGADSLERHAEFWFYKINGGGHTWPSGPPVPPGLVFALGHVNRDINASSEIWNFFNRHVLDPGVPSAIEHLDDREIVLSVFPNPFTSSLTFEFELPQASRVQLALYNTMGQQVAQIADQQLAVGMQRITWKPKSLSAGLYYYHLKVNDRLVSKPVVLKR